MFCIIANQTEANVWLTSVALDQLLRRPILDTYASSQWRGKKFLIEQMVKVKTLNGSEHDGRSFKRWYGFYGFTNQFLTTVCSTFNPTCDAQMRTGIHLLNVVWLKYDHFFIAKLIISVAYVNWALFFTIDLQCMCIKSKRRLICLVWIKKLFSKVKEFFMCVYVICMNKHVGITLSVFLLVLYSFFQCQI
jgi:hypothetical protein